MTRWEARSHSLKTPGSKTFEKVLLTSCASYVLLGEKHSHKQKYDQRRETRNVSTHQGAYRR
jgi:hypothetical protein